MTSGLVESNCGCLGTNASLPEKRTNAFDEFWRRVTVDGEVSFRSVFHG